MEHNRERTWRKRTVVAVAVSAIAGATAVGVAAATVLSQTMVVERAEAQIRIVETEVEDFDSGWHTHPGLAVVQVRDGLLRIYQGGCEPAIVGPGETYIEVPGQAVRGVVRGHAAWTTTLIVPKDAAFSTPTTDPCQ